MSIRDIKANLDAYTESLMKSGVTDVSPSEALKIISDYMTKVCGSVGSIVWYCGADGEEFARIASDRASEALQDAFGPSIKEAQFEPPVRRERVYRAVPQSFTHVPGASL